MIVDESNFDVFERASNKTCTDYEIKWFDAENIDGYIEGDTLVSMVEDLLVEIGRLEEQIEDIKQDIENNYELKKFDPYYEYGVRERDFY